MSGFTGELRLPGLRPQWRLAEVQLANWGTFDGAIYRIPIAQKGHLITGPSGSGKSSLLDAIASVLTPNKWLRFNTAAQGAGPRSAQRTEMSYVRGAWTRTTAEDEDKVVSRFLRPNATWSGILLRFEDGASNPVTLARLYFARGTATDSASLSDLCLVERSAIGLEELQEYARNGIEARELKRRFPSAVVTTNGDHRRFYARMRQLFEIADEGALQLLHKTQSAKSLDSLDQLFREYMLERPRTFEIVDTAVSQFGELRDAHAHVVQLRHQRDHLMSLREASEQFESATAEAESRLTLIESILPVQRSLSLSMAQAELASTREALIELGAAAERTGREAEQAEERWGIAQARVRERGGGEVEQLGHRIRAAEQDLAVVTERVEAFTARLAEAGIHQVPGTAEEFGEFVAGIDAARASAAPAPQASFEQNQRLFSARGEIEHLEREIHALRRTQTTIPSALLEVREELAAALGTLPAALPFAAELIQVRAEHAEWTGAIERVLRPFALTLLVRSEHLAAVRRWVDTHRIQGRLVYEEVGAAEQPRAAGSKKSLLHRLEIQPGPFGDWAQAVLSQRFDYACVDSPDEMDAHPRAVTINGQVKTTRTRYEKDDRTAISDRTRWVLGDRESKLEALVDRLTAARSTFEAAEAEVLAIQAAADAAARHDEKLRNLRSTRWQDVDADSAAHTLANLRANLAQLTRSDGDLASAVAAVEEANGERTAARKADEAARMALHDAEEKNAHLEREVADLGQRVADDPEIPAGVAEQLRARFSSGHRRITRERLSEIGQTLSQELMGERDAAQRRATTAGHLITRLATEFKTQWPASAIDLSPTLADREGFLGLLDEIVARGLPEHEDRFLSLLRERSRDLIGELVSEIHGVLREVSARIEPINDSLRRSEFDHERYLRLRVKLRRGEVVDQFIRDLRSISEGSWAEIDLESAETRFQTLADIMRRLASSESVDRSWRNQCLDTRLHVTFLADEVDKAGRAHATYDSGAAMSGGQQQKLVVFCLAAALRYQLADPDQEYSRYGTVVLDEAFDKADTRYTRMALDVFEEFGFHLVLATPQKLLQTIEPYVGGATSIENPSRQRSTVATIPWGEESA
ncbi:MAG: ATP-binding protein [bacterium]|nr:ATP-binding protein [bacterium]